MTPIDPSVKDYHAGSSYENFLQRILQSKSELRARCSGEMETLLAHERGVRLPRIVPSKAKLIETVRKKVLKAFDKLLKRRRMSDEDRTSLLALRDRVSQTQDGIVISEALEEAWPIVLRIIPMVRK